MSEGGEIIHLTHKNYLYPRNMYMGRIISTFFYHFQRSQKSFYAFVSLLLICLLAYNSATIFCIHLPLPAKARPEQVAWNTREVSLLPSSTEQNPVREESLIVNWNLRLHDGQDLVVSTNKTKMHHPKRRKRCKNAARILRSQSAKQFEGRVTSFFKGNSSESSCKFRFFMTWISSVESFGNREMFCLESVFKAHPNGCLIIVSSSLDSTKGMQILTTFLDKGFKVAAISPDVSFLFKNTAAQAWCKRLKRGNVDPGGISFGQNLSNLLRIGLLYRFGGIYLDTDMIVLRNFGELKNVIGAQTIDLGTRKWSRLNNAVMIFDKGHPLLLKFIEEFALTFNGNKWGHNGPYLVSRVVRRLSARPVFNITVLPPKAFYPVDWSKIASLFQGPKSLRHSKWLLSKLRQIQSQSFALHLWNKQSKKLKVEKGSIIQHIMLSSSVVRNPCHPDCRVRA